MLRILKVITIFILILIFGSSISYATEEIIKEQSDILNISSFVEEGERYTKEVFPEISIENLLTSAITGNIDNGMIAKAIFSLFGKEVISAITLLGSILVIIIVHSILKSISENIGNESVSKIAYYIEYILIVTLIMTNFVGIITMIKETIINLVRTNEQLNPNTARTYDNNWKCSICKFYTTINSFFGSIYSEI
jgi:stage III sporulation protein AE